MENNFKNIYSTNIGCEKHDNFFRCVLKRMFELILNHPDFVTFENDFIKLRQMYYDYCDGGIDIENEFFTLNIILCRLISNPKENQILFLKECNNVTETLFADELIQQIAEGYECLNFDNSV